jgi:hypothetical protein
MANKKGGTADIPDSLDDINLGINNTVDEVVKIKQPQKSIPFAVT